MKEWNKYKKEINDYFTGKLQTKDIVKLMGVQSRVVRAFKQKYKQRGEVVFIHGNKGKLKPRLKYKELENKVLDIFFNTRNKKNVNPYKEVTYRYFSEILLEKNIKVSETWLKKILKSNNYISPQSCEFNKNEHKNRFVREQFGELVQADGTFYDWFGDNKLRCIQGFIDDSTGMPLSLYMTDNECLLGYNEAFYQMSEKYGLPAATLVDGASVFFVNQKNVSKDEFQEKKITQFGKEMETLGVELLRAYSPQSKGKVERFWRTLKGRLVTDFLLNNIDNVTDANKYLKDIFLPKIQKRFGRKPKCNISMFVSVSDDVLKNTLRSCYKGKTDAKGYFTILGYKFICKELKNQNINIFASERDGIYISPINKDIRYDIILAEGDSSGSMPQVMKNLIDEFFLKDTKSSFGEVYYDLDANIA